MKTPMPDNLKMPMPDRSKAPAIHPFGVLTMPEETVEQVGRNVFLHLLRHGELELSSLHIVSQFDRAASSAADRASHHVLQMLPRAKDGMSVAEVAEVFDTEGAIMNVRPMGAFTALSFLLLDDTVSSLSGLIYDIFSNPVYDPSEVRNTLLQCRQKADMEERRCSWQASRAIASLMWGSRHPYGGMIATQDFDTVTADRLASLQYTEAHCHPIHVFLAGSMKEGVAETVRDLARRIDEGIDTLRPLHPIVPMHPEKGRIDIDMPESMQTAIALGLPIGIDRSHPDYIDLRLAVMALGGYFGSRLMTNIREEKGLCYGINAALMCEPEGTQIRIAAECNPQGAATAIEEIRNEIMLLRNTPMSGEELERLRGFAFSQLATQLDTPMAIQDAHINRLTLGIPPDYFSEQCRCTRSLTPERIQEMAQKYMSPDEMRIVTAGPINKP